MKTYYGSKRVGRGPAMPIALAEGQRLIDLTIPLLRGAVIEGTVFDENGVPLSSAQVQRVPTGSRQRRAQARQSTGLTVGDDGRPRHLSSVRTAARRIHRAGGRGQSPGRNASDDGRGDCRGLAGCYRVFAGGRAATGGGGAPIVARTGAYFPGVTDAALAEFFTLVVRERPGAFEQPLGRRLEGRGAAPARPAAPPPRAARQGLCATPPRRCAPAHRALARCPARTAADTSAKA